MGAKSVKKVILICPGAKSPFVLNDAAALRRKYPVEVVGVDTMPSPRKLFLMFRLFSSLAAGNVLAVALFFSVPAYAPLVVLLAKIFRKKVIIITGGYDTTYVPVIDWGEMKSAWKRAAQRIALSGADLALAFSEFSRSDVLRYGSPKRIRPLYFGIDTKYFKPAGKKQSLVLSVCYQINASTLVQKGIRTMIECARLIPDAQFVVVGEVQNDAATVEARQTAPENFLFCDRFIPREELLQYYRRARVYLQASAHEGFGIAVAEAMACSCVPVGTLNTSLPEVIGDAGYLVPFGDVHATADAVHRALRAGRLATKARDRIVRCFPAGRREKELLQEFQNVVNQ